MTDLRAQTIRRTGGLPPDPRDICEQMKTNSKGSDA